jgi:hypothetical protein
MSELRKLIARMDQIDSGSLPKKKKIIKEDATTASRSIGGDIIGGIKSAGPIVSKVGNKALPVLGAVMSADSAHDRFNQGDYTGSAIDAVAAGTSLYPPAWPVALGASGVNMLRDKAKEVGGWGNLAKEIGQSMKDHDDTGFLPEDIETLDEAGFVKWLEESGLHNLDEGPIDLIKAGASKVGPAVKSGLGKLKDLVTPAEKGYKPAPPLNTTGEIVDVSKTTPISGTGDTVPGKVSVTPDTGKVPKTNAQRQQDLKDVEAQINALPKPKINAKDYEAQLAKQKELQQQLKDPRPAVWKDPRNPNAPASKNPPPADVEPPQPLNGKSFKDASAEVNARAEPPKINRDDLGRELDDLGRPTRTLGGDPINYGPAPSTTSTSTSTTVANTDKPTQLNPFRGPSPEPSVYGPGGIKNFRQDAPFNPEYINYPRGATSAEKDAMFARAQSEYEKQMGWHPGFKTTAAAAAGAAAVKYGPDFVKSYVDTPNKDQPPADTTQTKESLQNKLFKEFKTFVEKR